MIDVSIVEDDTGAREALAIVLAGTPGFRCVSKHASAEDALQSLPVEKADVVLMDLGLPEMSGIECIGRLKERQPKLLLMVLTVHEDTDKIFDSLKAGATGYILKRTPPADILTAISELVSGGSPMSPGIARKVTQYFHERPATKTDLDLDTLTDREREILHQVATGYPLKEIAERFNISIETVRNHLRNIYQKLHVHSRAEATAKYLQG